MRDSVEDWEKMRAQALEIVEELTTSPPPLDTLEVERGRAFLEWLADDHFTFLGYREYHLEREGDDEILRAVPGTGLGILRADQDQSKAFAKLPDAGQGQGPREDPAGAGQGQLPRRPCTARPTSTTSG